MTNLALQKKAVEVAVILNAAVANIRLYPPSSDIIGTSVGRLETALNTILGEVDSIVFSESEKHLLVSGQALNEKDQQKPQVLAFLEMLGNAGIKSITFAKGVDKGELLSLLEIASASPEKIKSAGGLKQMVAAKNLSHVFLDQKVYVAMDNDKEVVSTEAGGDETGPAPEPGPVEPAEIDRRTGTERRQDDGAEYLANGGPERRSSEDRRKVQVADYKEKLASILRGETVAFSDLQVMKSLPATIDQLLTKSKDKVAEALIDKLVKGLLDEDPALRGDVAEALTAVSARLMAEQRQDMLRTLLLKLLGLMKQDVMTQPVFEQICRQLQSTLEASIQNYQLDESIRILRAFRAIEQGQLTKNETFQEICGAILNEIAGGAVRDALVQEMQTNQMNQKDQAIACLALMGPVIIDHLLDLLQENEDKTLQARTLQVLTGMGSEAVPHITTLLEQDLPVETVRQLVGILGKISGEENLAVFVPLVSHKDIRVQREALNSIFSVGGDARGSVLQTLLSTADDSLKPAIVAMLGTLKYQPAVPELLELLESKSIIASKSKNELAEKICAALGKIGAAEAVPALTAIAESKGLFKIKTYPAPVQSAAKAALELIKG